MTASCRAPATPQASRRFYGWRIVAYSTVVLAMTAPGQTIGVSVFIDPMMETLDLTRSQVSGAYLVGTLIGGTTMPFVGSLIDRHGVRRVMTLVAVGFGLAVATMAGVGGLIPLLLGFTGIRLLGQGSLTLTSTTAVALWFERRRGFAMGLQSSLGTGIMSFAPLALTALIATVGWRSAWVISGAAVWAIVLPMARFGMIDSPAHLGLELDGDPKPDVPVRAKDSWTRPEVMRSLMFWALTGAVSAAGLIGTAVVFHQISLLGERGLSTAEAAANFIPQTLAVIVATLVVGVLVDRHSPKLLAASSMVLLAASLVLVQMAAPGFRAVAYALAIGAAGGAARAVSQAAVPRYFGIGHIGAIRGMSMTIAVLATAVGPYLLAVGYERFGTYGPPLTAMLVIPALVVMLLAIARVPDEHLHARVRHRLSRA